MKKELSRGFMLIETLIVTTFVSGVLIFLFVQLTTLSNNYDTSYKNNTVESLYSLKNIKRFVTSDSIALTRIDEKILSDGYIEISDCSIFTEVSYCLKLFDLENIKYIFVTPNEIDKDLFSYQNDALKKFINRINSDGTEKYRLIAEFEDSKFATLRFGE